jgi:hypothetical protein
MINTPIQCGGTTAYVAQDASGLCPPGVTNPSLDRCLTTTVTGPGTYHVTIRSYIPAPYTTRIVVDGANQPTENFPSPFAGTASIPMTSDVLIYAGTLGAGQHTIGGMAFCSPTGTTLGDFMRATMVVLYWPSP